MISPNMRNLTTKPSQPNKNKFIAKENRFVVTRGRGYQEGELAEGKQKIKTSSYKTNKYQGCNVQHAVHA